MKQPNQTNAAPVIVNIRALGHFDLTLNGKE